MKHINPYLVMAIAAGILAGYVLAKRESSGCTCNEVPSSSSQATGGTWT